MSVLRDKLLQSYATHYARVNRHIDPNKMLTRKRSRDLRLMYGKLVSGLGHDAKVLDLGCGSGGLLAWLVAQNGPAVHGVDVSESQIAIAREAVPQATVERADGLAYLRSHPNTFSGIFCIDVLEHAPTIDDCLELVETARMALVPGGFFICRVPNAANLTGGYSRYMDLTHERCFTRTSLVQLLEAAGLRDTGHVPVRVSSITGRIRRRIEDALHRCAFRVCGRAMEPVFTSNVYAIGHRPND